MYLSNRLTFSIFSILLVAALVVAPTAMAQVTVTAYIESTTYAAGPPVVKGKVVITFTYSEDPDPVPVLSDFTATDGQIGATDDDGGDRDVLKASFVSGAAGATTAKITSSGKTVTLTLEDADSDVTVPAGLTLKGYSTGLDSGLGTDLAGATSLVLATNHLAGYAYRVYLRSGDATLPVETARPVLPSTLGEANLAAIDPTTTTGNSNVAMPDLEEFFNVGGGTIDLVITTTTGTGADAVTTAAAENFDVIINEIMWGVDNSRVGQDGYTNQQWIEVYNRKTTPVPNPTFIFTDDTFPAPPKVTGVVDRITNIAGHQNVWNPAIKGSSGTATRSTGDTPAIIGADPAFVSIYRSKQDGDGANAAHWKASDRFYFPGFKGTPGTANEREGLPSVRTGPTAYTPPKDKVIINEVFNHSSDDSLDWIEFRNVSTGEVNLKGWRLNHTGGATVTNTSTDDQADEQNIIHFNWDIKIPAGEVLLIVNSDPEDTGLAAGQNIREARANQTLGAGQHKYLNIKASHNTALNIPASLDAGGFLILRSHADNKFKTSRTHMHDVAGSARVTKNTLGVTAKITEPENGSYWNTLAWPINGHTGNNYRAHNAGDSNNNNASLDPAHAFKSGEVWARNGTLHGWRKGGGAIVGYSGGLGYDRDVMGAGTPGYHNDVVKGKTGDIDDGGLIISELMLTSDNGRYPQWIELHNTSRTKGINLTVDGSDADKSAKDAGWRMIIENHNSGSWLDSNRKLNATINLKDFEGIEFIPPNQTVLIASRSGRHSSGTGHFPSHRVASVWGTNSARAALDMKNSRQDMLNAAGGFYIKIVDGAGNVSDEIGNLDGKEADLREGIELDDPYSWRWPTALTTDDKRTSLIRLMDGGTRGVQGTVFGKAGMARKGVPDRTMEGDMTGSVIPMSTSGSLIRAEKNMKAAWVHAVDTALATAKEIWYGSSDDFGTPLHTSGTALPVELSFFRPTSENGKVTIQWTTESELDNAGFNILRSETRDGEFTQVNEQMIQGKGTTAERTTYKWIDTTAKPGAIYYYQIEDISFSGQHNQLAVTKLKGLISAKGKLTTSWGDIKNAAQ